jgi:Ni,Fe-hydrogenase I large subunit
MDPATSSFLSSVANIFGIGASLFGIGEALFGGSSVSTPKLSIPQVQTFQIPQADLDALNKQIAQNTQLSDSARQAALDAINSYNRGELSAAYAGEYQNKYNQMKQQVLQQLAAQGFTQGSQQYINAMSQLENWAANLKSQLLQQQLEAGLKMAGLSDNAIKDLLTTWQTQSNINAQNNQAKISQAEAENQAKISQYQANLLNNQIQTQKMGNALTAASNLASSLGNLTGSSSKSTSTPTSTNNIYSWSDLLNPQQNAISAAYGNPVFISTEG